MFWWHLSDLIDRNNSLHQWLSTARAKKKNKKTNQGCIATTDCSLFFRCRSVLWNKQTSIIYCSRSLFNSLPPFMPSSFFGGQEQSVALMGAPRRIEFNSWGAERGWLAPPALHYLPFTSLSLHGLPSGILALRPSSRRSQMEQCFVPSALLSSVPLPAQALRWKITFWGQTLIILLAPRAPSTRLIILALRDENLELLFSSYQSRRLQALSVDKDPVSVYDREQRGSKTNRLGAYVSQNLIAEVLRTGSSKTAVYLCEWVANEGAGGQLWIQYRGQFRWEKKAHVVFFYHVALYDVLIRDFPFSTLRLLPGKCCRRGLSE